MIDSKSTADVFSALSHPLRVDILKCLLAHCPAGLSAGQIAKLTKLAPSTLSHHLDAMEAGNIIARSINGRSTTISLDFASILGVANTLMQLCCTADQQERDAP